MTAYFDGTGTTPRIRRRTPRTAWHRPLAVCAAAMGALAAFSAVGLLVDGRTVMGENVWLKPLKFALSFGLYAITLAWMIGSARTRRRTLWWLGTLTAAAFVLPEISAITFQAARGVRSHFNVGTALDGAVFMVMGGAAYLGWALTLAVGIVLVLQHRSARRAVLTRSARSWVPADGAARAMACAVPLGVLVSLAGMSVGYLMTAPTPDQAQALDAGATLATIGAHSVGAPDGGAGMPVTGWSTGSGDLRAAHFVGIHALQVLPLVALAVKRARLVAVAAFGYSGLTGLLVWQARRGQALLEPDTTTLLAAGGLAAVVAVTAVAVSVIRPEQRGRLSRDEHGRTPVDDSTDTEGAAAVRHAPTAAREEVRAS
ncbi:hypothetical protein ACLQ2N_21765 [Streptomyces sp. DT224]|uniref:hypothetical protein n=1 Tax=Streptomyces sp. DT224 TaxID=3393426 RepID=UPI003CF78DB2